MEFLATKFHPIHPKLNLAHVLLSASKRGLMSNYVAIIWGYMFQHQLLTIAKRVKYPHRKRSKDSVAIVS